MPRVTIALPEPVIFETRLDVRIGDINYGQHMANDAFLRFAHEARIRFLAHFGYTELSAEGSGLIMADAAISFRAEVFHGTTLRIAMGIGDTSRAGFDLLYHLCDDNSGQEVARLKTGMVFFDYNTRKIASVPQAFLAKLSGA